MISLCSGICLFATGCGGGGGRALPPPAAVTNLAATRTAALPGKVALVWDAGSTLTKGYLVARRLQGETKFLKLTPRPIKDATFTDTLPAGRELVTPTYQVVTVDKRDRVSAPAETTPVIGPPEMAF